jgi:hypothetical protein
MHEVRPALVILAWRNWYMWVLRTLIHWEGDVYRERVLKIERDLTSKEKQRDEYIETRG